MKTYTKEELTKIVADHKKWLLGEAGGMRADLCFADLRSADLRSADLRFADLHSANLRSADLRFADLRSADLHSADLRFADLHSAKTDHRYVSISGIGSAKRVTIFDLTDGIVMCGCFRGTMAEFEKRVKETNSKNKVYLAEYLGAIKYVRSLMKTAR